MNCLSCGSSTADRCTRCGESPYCGLDCQCQHWPSHRDTCKDIQLAQALQRVADVLLEAYLTFRENTWHIDVNRVEVDEKTHTLTVYDDNKENPGYFTKFPEHLVEGKPELRMAVLSAWHGSEPYGSLHILTMKLLQGMNIDIEEINVSPLRGPGKVRAVMCTGQKISNYPVLKHALLRLTSRRTKKQWIIDICGGQYGIYQPLHEWTQYQARYGAHLTAVFDAGFARGLFADLSKIKGSPAITFGLIGEAAKALDKRIDTWERLHKPLIQLRALDATTFAKEKRSLLRALSMGTRSFIAKNDFTIRVRSEKKTELKSSSASKCAKRMADLCERANKLSAEERAKKPLAEERAKKLPAEKLLAKERTNKLPAGERANKLPVEEQVNKLPAGERK